jgi:transposase
MSIHANAALTIKQRKEAKRLHEKEGISIRELAERFGVNKTTIQRWVHRDSALDLSPAPKRRRSGLTKSQKEAVLNYRKENPKAGAITIAFHLSKEYGYMSHATVGRFLRANGLTRPQRKKPVETKPLKVGRHRLQMDIQQLPAVRGGKGFEYKITIIHMATRMKYSEIHDHVTSETVAQAVKNCLAHLPPFFFNMD